MLKKKNAKKIKENYIENATRIKCQYCDIKESCKTRASKEKSESLGIITYCTLTPNVTRKSKSKLKRNK